MHALNEVVTELSRLRVWWLDPSRRLRAQRANAALLAELESLEGERARIRSLLMGGRAAAKGQIAKLAERVARLGQAFSLLSS
jgi:hypothetical protein